MESNPGEDAVKTVEVIIKDWECFINLVDKAAAGLENTDFSFKRSCIVGKMLSNSIAYYIQFWWEEESVYVTYFTVVLILINCRSHPNLQNYTLIT